jgi:hypothetical protein
VKLARLALAVAVAGALVAAFAPLGRTCMPGPAPGADPVCSGTSAFSVDGWWVLAVGSVPVALSLVAALARSRAAWTACAVLLWAFCVVGISSIGLFLVPAAILMTVAAVRREPAQTRPA